MRASTRRIRSDSPRSKNMPSLVRAAFTSLPSAPVATVSERARRVLASVTMPSHSASLSRSANTTTRGWRRAITTLTARSPAITTGAKRLRSGSGRPGVACTAGASVAAWPSVRARASRATTSSQPLPIIAARMLSAACPAWSCSVIHAQSSGVMTCWLMVGGGRRDDRARRPRGRSGSHPSQRRSGPRAFPGDAGSQSGPSGRGPAWRRS
mmetsp:Transcript_41204/g.96289  ORF Transcript_41204/g.96289 Transcript_41204/m.96289 type:complete len:211 (+) Transcript_41204:436-1068(+)